MIKKIIKFLTWKFISLSLNTFSFCGIKFSAENQSVTFKTWKNSLVPSHPACTRGLEPCQGRTSSLCRTPCPCRACLTRSGGGLERAEGCLRSSWKKYLVQVSLPKITFDEQNVLFVNKISSKLWHLSRCHKYFFWVAWLRSVWQYARIKSSPIFTKVAIKEAKAVFTYKEMI